MLECGPMLFGKKDLRASVIAGDVINESHFAKKLKGRMNTNQNCHSSSLKVRLESMDLIFAN